MGVFDRFLNTVDTSGGVPILSRSNPANWTRIWQTIAFALVATVSLAFQRIVGAMVAGYTSIVTGVTEFVAGTDAPAWVTNPRLREAFSTEGLFGVIAGEVGETVAATWGNAFTAVPGVFRLPTQLAVLLAAFYVVNWGVNYARAEVL